jgi:hypothetical protein
LIVTLDPLTKVLGAATVIAAVFLALNDVDVIRHLNSDLGLSRWIIKKGMEIFHPFLVSVAGTTRLELATSGVTGRRSNQN